MSRPIITLTTDFGLGSTYLAEMKGVLLTRAADAQIIDLSHTIQPQEIRQAAFTVAQATQCFPAGTIHVVVVDPGVGTERKIVAARFGSQTYLAPDNGVLSLLATEVEAGQIVSVENRSIWCEKISPTFHGRDIFCPVAAHLAMGNPLEDLGGPLPDIEHLEWPGVEVDSRKITGAVLAIDSFGNLITNISADLVSEAFASESISVSAANRPTRSIARTYANFETGRLIALIGSHGRVELSLVGGNAARQLEIGPGEPVVVEW